MTWNRWRLRVVTPIVCAAVVLATSCTTSSDATSSTTTDSQEVGETPQPTGDGSGLPVVVGDPDTTAVDESSSTEEVLGGINGSALEKRHGQAVALVLSRSCDGIGYGTGSGFAIGPRTIVTNWHVVAEDYDDVDSPIDPRPWILTYNRRWMRGTVIGATAVPDVAVIQIDETDPEMAETLNWHDEEIVDGEHVAILGYPGLESGEFNLAVGKVENAQGVYEGIPTFDVVRSLSARTGPGNSGGPGLTAEGDVAGVHTWGRYSRSNWLLQDVRMVSDSVDAILDGEDGDTPPPSCEADSTDRYPLAYTVRLGTFANDVDAQRRLEVVEGVRDDVQVVSVSSDGWQPFLLSDYPIVTMAGPFDDRADAEAAVEQYQAAIDAAGQNDRFSVGVMPRSVFGPEQQSEAAATCGDLSGSTTLVTGISPSDPLKLRAQPSTSANVLAELEDGETLALRTDEPVEANGLTWLAVEYDSEDGPLCGWVAKRYTTVP